MEKTIEALLNSFETGLTPLGLQKLDEFLINLLFEKEVLLVSAKKVSRIREIENILTHYSDYRRIIYQRLNKKIDGRILKRNIYQPPTRLILLLTHNCQLRCRYCRVRKFPASMQNEVLFAGIDLLFTSERRDIQLQFFGGEPLLSLDSLKKAVKYAEKINKKAKKNLLFVLTTNGILLEKDTLAFLKKHNFLIEFSIDGEIESQLKTRMAYDGKNYYAKVINNLKHLFSSNLSHYSISVVMPGNVCNMYDNFVHLSELGFKRIQMNYSLGIFWPKKSVHELMSQTNKIMNYLKKRKDVEFINLTETRREPVVLNAELTLDCDGNIYLESGICLEEDFQSIKNKFFIKELRCAKDINMLGSTPFYNFYRLSQTYATEKNNFRRIILNNILLGRLYESFIKKLNKSALGNKASGSYN